MKTEYVKISLSDLVEKYGESRVKAILADFSVMASSFKSYYNLK